MEETYDQDNPWHVQVQMLGAFNCAQCDALLPWNEEMAGCPQGDNDEFLKRCVAVAQRAKTTGWVSLGGHHNFLCPECAAKHRRDQSSGAANSTSSQR